VTAMLVELCYLYTQPADKDDAKDPAYMDNQARMRAAIGLIMWEMNDTGGLLLRDINPAQEDDPSAAKKEQKEIDALIAAHAKAFVPDKEDDTEGAGETADEGADTVAV
jgi:hypothetical protein